ncbi:MAG: translocation/assembly module TamB [Chitinophagales bacterium]|nr:translocation/assembly module TamB [Chitinophagales bacterium]
MQAEEEQKIIEEKGPEKGRFSVVRRWIKRLALLVIVPFLVLILLFQIPAVQNWAAQKAATSLSKTLQTTVALEKLSFSFFDELELSDLFIEDVTKGDTLLYSSRLYANFDLNPVTYFLKGLVIEEIRLDSARINIRKAEAAPENNIQIFLSRLFPPDTTTYYVEEEKRPFRLDIKRLKMNQIRFVKDDKERGQTINVFLYSGELNFDELNLPHNYINASSILLKGPYVKINEYFGTPYQENYSDSTGFEHYQQENYIEESYEEEFSIKQPLFFTATNFKIEDAKFSLHNWRNEPQRLSPLDELDYQHMDIYDINIDVDDFTFCEDSLDFTGQVEQMSCKALSGFELENLSAKKARVWCQGMELYDMNLKTPYSNIGDTLVFQYSTYEDWTDFPSRIYMRAYINNSSVTLNDIITFAPKLKENTFFRNNANRQLYMDGFVKGRINRLSGEDINIWLEDRSLVIRGEFGTRDITVRQSELVNLNLQELSTNMSTLRQLIPGFDPPANFNNLGNLRFNGRVDGYFTDFVADGRLISDLGLAEMNMQIQNLKQGRASAHYRGELKLIDFDLGGWSQNPDLGKVNFYSLVDKGVGLTAETASAELMAKVDSFYYKGYRYENAQLMGSLQKNLFRGDFSIDDQNFDFSFTGEVNLRDSIPRFNFQAAVNRLDLQRLNLSEQDIVLSGNVMLDVQNDKFSKLEGKGTVADFSISHEKLGKTTVDSILFKSGFDDHNKRSFTIDSDVIQANLYGLFDIEQVPAAFMQYLSKHYPSFFTRLGLKPPKKEPAPHQFTFDISILDTKNLLEFFEPSLGPISGGKIEGIFDNIENSIDFSVKIPQFKYNKIALNNIGIIAELEGSEGFLDLIVTEPVINDNPYSDIKIATYLEQDTMSIALAYDSETSRFFNNINLNTKLFLEDSLNYRLEFGQSNLVLLEMPWLINKNNYITFRKGFVDTDNFLLINNDKEIRLQSITEKGLKLALNNMNFDYIDEIWDYEQLDFSGKFNLTAEVNNIFEMTGIAASIQGDTIWINDDDFGVFRLDLQAKDLKSQLHANLFITHDTSQIIAEGHLNLANQSQKAKAESTLAQYFDFNIYATNLPVAIAEYWLEGTVSNTVGHFDADLRIFGLPPQPHISGDIHAQDVAITIDFLQTRYFIEEGTIDAKDFLFDATGTIVKDRFGNTATVTGGMTHNYLKELGINALLNTDRFLALDTKKGDNDLFYGRAIGFGEITFQGPLNRIDIYVNASVVDGTHLVIPVSYGGNTSELSFINFSQRKPKQEELSEEEKEARDRNLTGIDLSMDLVITEEALGEIVFDEQAGDIIKGKGRGDIRILVPRNGGFQMYGQYIIEEGDYLFTLYNVVNKKFTVKRGGVITWSGDPFEANINLEAEYRGLSTSVANFIPEYLVNAPEEIQNDALKATEVDLTMDLNGDLLHPRINFNIEFPNLTGGLKTYTDSKLRVIRQDPNELNRQVFGLIVAGQFLPSDFAFEGADIFYNTVSEFISNQLSLLLTELFSDFFSNGGNNFDFDIAYNQYQSTGIQDGNEVIRGDEFQVRLKQDFFNDRLTILVGGNVDIGNSARTTNPEATGTFVGNDVVIEYVLNDDRTMKLRVYQRLEPDIGGGSRLEVGTGLSFRKEFDSFGEFLRSFKRDGKRMGN